MNIRRFLIGLTLLCAGVVHAQQGVSTSGSITTQNLVPTGSATTNSCVALDVTNKGTVAVGVSGTYTGALSLQRTANGSTWETLSASSTFTNVAGTATATIGSGTTGTFAVSNVAGFRSIRVCGLAAVTGTATVTIYTSIPGGGGGGGSGGGGGAVTVADGADVALGATTDAASGADTAGTVNAHLRELTKSNSQLPAALLTSGSFDVASATRTDYLGLAAANVVPKFVKITASGSGNNAIVAAVSSKKIRVIAYALSPNAAVNAKWQSDGAGTPVDLTGLIYMTAQGNGIAQGFNPVGYFESASGKSLDLNLSGGVAVGGYVVYVEI